VKETTRSCTASFLFLLAAGSACAQVDVKTVKPDGVPNKAAWMAQGTYGMMVHYLMMPQGNIKPRCPIEDYHAGEIHLLEDGKIRTDFVYPPGQGNIIVTADGKLRKRGQEARFYMPDSQFIDNVQTEACETLPRLPCATECTWSLAVSCVGREHRRELGSDAWTRKS